MEATPLAPFDGVLMDGLEFCSKVYELFESIRKTIDGRSRLRRRPTHVEKKLLEELLPICKYVQESYRPGRYLSVRWVDGTQSYDAELRQHGAYVEQGVYSETGFLEVTCTMHPNEYLSRELLDTEGFAYGPDGIRRLRNRAIESVPVVYANGEFIESYAAVVVDQISKKALIPYPENTTLIVQCTLNMPYMPDEWEQLISRVRATLPQSRFREIYLYDTVCHYSKRVFPLSADENSRYSGCLADLTGLAAQRTVRRFAGVHPQRQ